MRAAAPAVARPPRPPAPPLPPSLSTTTTTHGHMPPQQAAPALTLVTWDIDGTLLRATGDRANALHRAAFASAWATVLGAPLDLQTIPHQGSTDPLILLKGGVHTGAAATAAELMGNRDTGNGGPPLPPPVPPTADPASPLAAMVGEMLRFVGAAAPGAVAEGLELLPGVATLLAALAAREDVLVGLVTGNLAPVAAAKVEALGVSGHFTPLASGSEAGSGLPSDTTPAAAPLLVGGFGSDHCSGNYEEPWHDRTELIRLARARAQAAAGAAGRVGRVVHLGDTPFDLLAAVGAGADAVGVCTGVHTRAELEAVEGGGVVVLDDLSDTAAALAALGLA